MTDPNPYEPTVSELRPMDLPSADDHPAKVRHSFSKSETAIWVFLPLIALGGLWAFVDLFLYTFVYGSGQRYNTPFVVAVYTSPLVLSVAVITAISRPRWRLRTWLLGAGLCLLPAILTLLSVPVFGYYHD